ncbi:MAG: viroplasmin family protein [Bacteroidales bacterium]|nr:viroplasmin family protein [Bacteroidales bacterium]
MTKQKYYVVWQGLQSGIYDNWNECRQQVLGVEGAKYKSFENLVEAQQALQMGYAAWRKQNPVMPQSTSGFVTGNEEKPILESLSVDAACNMKTRVMEYRGVDTKTGAEIFHVGPFKNATNNMGEFLALVHGLALLKQKGSNMPIYSDSITAIAWVRQKKHKSTVRPTAENALLFNLMERAENWLKSNTFTNPIYKWNTPLWGEIPADFGRK